MDLSSHGGGEMPIPMPLNSKFVGHHHSIQPSSNGPSPTQPPTSEPHQSLSYNLSTMNIKKGGGGGVVVKYRECLKNHAAAIGGNATDGCGEFMPSGEEGTMEALKCSACNCHRNFHRKEVEGETYDPPPFHHHHQFMKHSRNKVVGQKGVLVSSHSDTTFGGYNPILPLPSPHHMIMPIGAMQTSESDEIEGIAGGGGGGIMSRPPTTKKRFRTKFTPDQKEKMLSFAEKVGWRLQRQEEGEVQRFCQEIGVKRRVLKVWMHNNKHNLARRSTISITAAATATNNSTMSNSNPIQMQVQGPHISMQTDM